MRKIKVVQNCLKWRENWSKMIFEFFSPHPTKKVGYIKQNLPDWLDRLDRFDYFIHLTTWQTWLTFVDSKKFEGPKSFSDLKFACPQNLLWQKRFLTQSLFDQLLLTDFVGKLECGSAQLNLFFIFNLFRRIFRGSFRFKKIPSSKKPQVDFRGGPFLKSPNFTI